LVANSGSTALTGLSVKSECSCHFKSKLPTTLEPGARCELELQLPTPPAGKDIAHFEFFADGRPEPIQRFDVSVQAPVNAPTWMRRIDLASGTGIAGEEYSTEIVLEAIEDATDPPWVRSVSVEPEEFAVAKLQVDERRWTDDDNYLIRAYRVKVNASPAGAGVSEGTISFRAADEAPLAKVRARINVIAPISALPDKVELRSGKTGSFAHVDVVSRLPSSRQVVPDFDSALVNVGPLPDAPDNRLIFEIRPTSQATDETTTLVTFRVGDAEPARVEVRLIP